MIENSFVAIKPDGILRGLAGEIITRFEKKGYKIIAMKMVHPDENLASVHYAEHKGKSFYDRTVRYLTSGPVIAMVIQGHDVISGIRHVVGVTNPNEADVGTIRADYSEIMQQNIIHASDSPQSAEREIGIWFKPEELCTNWKTINEMLLEQNPI